MKQIHGNASVRSAIYVENILKNHSITTHRELQDRTESECEENAEATKDKKKTKKRNKNKKKETV